MVYDVIMSEPAESEATEAFLWLNHVAPDFAGRWYEGLLGAIASLATFPKRCPVAPENDEFPDATIRQLLYPQGKTVYRVLFCIIEPDTVRVLHIRHSAQQNDGSGFIEE